MLLEMRTTSVLFLLFIFAAEGFVPQSKIAHGISSSCHQSLRLPQMHQNCLHINDKYAVRLNASAVPATTREKKGAAVAKSVLSASLLIILDITFRRLFQKLSISFPSSLGGCCALFASMLAMPFGQSVFKILSPGAALLAKWLPVFFVPSLITLPLTGGVGSAGEVNKVNDAARAIKQNHSLSVPFYRLVT